MAQRDALGFEDVDQVEDAGGGDALLPEKRPDPPAVVVLPEHAEG